MASKLQGIGFVRKLWSDKPEIAGSLCLMAVGVVGQIVFSMRYDKDLNHQHRWNYTVIRRQDADPDCVKKGVYN